jgi:hypothetical protein
MPAVDDWITTVFRMDDETWMRHANPWSVWSRATVLPLLILAGWSHTWIGWWWTVPFVLVLGWTWLNPRLFAKPATTDRWASKCVFGERVWIKRDTHPIPKRHRVFPHVLNGFAGLGGLLCIWGVVQLALWPTVLGAVIQYAGKFWFLDRMVWLFEDMRDTDPKYAQWVY